ncbi:MAG: oxygen-independent coproporphyrinogen-3 oxidase [Alcanivorax sp.]|jgi:oxygen-independent coproporphyrinogen-3 oxidase
MTTVLQLPPLSLYVHLPWCERKCPYCDFNSHESDELPERDYLDALLADLHGAATLAQGRTLNSVFIGGGTPSLFSADSISRLLTSIGNSLEVSATMEVTMEANPGSAESNKFIGFRQAGVNRLSLGVQSFNDQALLALGRAHDSEQAHAAVEMTLAAGFDSFNLDLMHGLPGQDIEAGLKDLATAIGHRPPHLSWYQLTIEPNTVFHKRPPTLPLEDTLANIQDQGEVLLRQAGLLQYEVSAYAQPGYKCRHNQNYWSFGDYLGIGAGAHGKVSFEDGRIERYANRRQPDEFMAHAGEPTTNNKRVLKSEALPGEFMLNVLRQNSGSTFAEFESRTGLTATSIQAPISSLCDRGLLVCTHDSFRATPLGLRFLDTVVAEFFPD